MRRSFFKALRYHSFLQSFYYQENGDRGAGTLDEAVLLCARELLEKYKISLTYTSQEKDALTASKEEALELVPPLSASDVEEKHRLAVMCTRVRAEFEIKAGDDRCNKKVYNPRR